MVNLVIGNDGAVVVIHSMFLLHLLLISTSFDLLCCIDKIFVVVISFVAHSHGFIKVCTSLILHCVIIKLWSVEGFARSTILQIWAPLLPNLLEEHAWFGN